MPKRSAANGERDALDDDVDALFRLSLAEFTGARNALAAQLKKNGRGDEAARVKALTKPPVSAWAVNQLYWNHREAFDRLIASGERFHKAQKSGKVADMRTALEGRREALTHLSDLATTLLRGAGPNSGQNPSLEIIRRITSTLEALSVYASSSDAPRPGRLTHDVDPPGFESFGTFVPAATTQATASRQAARDRQQKAGGGRQAAGTTQRATQDKHQVEETRKAKIAAARVSLQDAKRSLTQARTRAQSVEAAQKKADAEAKKAEKQRRDIEDELKKAKADLEDAVRRARSAAEEVKEAVSAVDDAERAVQKATKELESLFGESSGR